MVPIYTAAAVQCNIRPAFPDRSGELNAENIQKNLSRVTDIIERVAQWNPSKLYVLPEFFMTGAGGVGRDVHARKKICVRIPGPEIEQLCTLAKNVKAYIAGMVWEVMDDWPDRYWNTAFILSPEGEVVLKYHKHYDPTGKTKPGDVLEEYIDRYGEDQLFPVVDTPIGRMGCLVCYDINFPEMARCLALNGAELILHPTSEGRAPFLLEDEGGWEIGKRARAYENLAYVISCNQGSFLDSDYPSERMRGRSQFIDFTGRVINIAQTTGEAILQADIEIERLRNKRAQMQMNFLAQLQTGVHARQYARKPMWPQEMWASEPPPSDMANVMEGRKVIKQLLENGTFVPPSSSVLDKDSFV